VAREGRVNFSTDTVPRSNELTWWQCPKGHRWKMRFSKLQAGQGCPYCAGKARKTEADYHDLAKERGLKWVGEAVPANVVTTTTWQCPNGHRWERAFNPIQQGNGCPRCSGRGKTEADYHAAGKPRSIKWVGKVLPATVHTKTTWQCPKGHRWEAAINTINQGHGCPGCLGRGKTEADYRAAGKPRGIRWLGTVLPKTTRTETIWQCAKRHRWESIYKAIQRGAGCPRCSGREKREADYQAIGKPRGIAWVGRGMPASAKTKTLWRCSKGHRWEACFGNIQVGNGCPHCAGKARKTEADYRAVGKDRGIRWIGSVLPEDTSTATLWQCSRGHRWEAHYTRVRLYNCSYCTGRARKTEADYRTAAKDRGIRWVGRVLPESSKTKTAWKCRKGHRWHAHFNSIDQGRSCPACAGRRSGWT
jgi:Probable Zinc-ribbon domain